MAAPREIRRRIPADDRRALVVRAALDVFASHGYVGATTAAIAERAGVSQPYVVRLFGTKRALFLEVLGHAHGQIAAAFRAAAGDDPPDPGHLRAMGDAFEAMLSADAASMRCLLHGFAAAADDPAIAAVVRGGYGDLVELVEERSGADPAAVLSFFSTGMFLIVAAVAGLPAGAAAGDARLGRLLGPLRQGGSGAPGIAASGPSA